MDPRARVQQHGTYAYVSGQQQDQARYYSNHNSLQSNHQRYCSEGPEEPHYGSHGLIAHDDGLGGLNMDTTTQVQKYGTCAYAPAQPHDQRLDQARLKEHLATILSSTPSQMNATCRTEPHPAGATQHSAEPNLLHGSHMQCDDGRSEHQVQPIAQLQGMDRQRHPAGAIQHSAGPNLQQGSHRQCDNGLSGHKVQPIVPQHDEGKQWYETQCRKAFQIRVDMLSNMVPCTTKIAETVLHKVGDNMDRAYMQAKQIQDKVSSEEMICSLKNELKKEQEREPEKLSAEEKRRALAYLGLTEDGLTQVEQNKESDQPTQKDMRALNFQKPRESGTFKAACTPLNQKHELSKTDRISNMQKKTGGRVNDTEEYVLCGDIWLSPTRAHGNKYCTRCERTHYMDLRCWETHEVHSEAPINLRKAILAAPESGIRILTQQKQYEKFRLSKGEWTPAAVNAEVDKEESDYYTSEAGNWVESLSEEERSAKQKLCALQIDQKIDKLRAGERGGTRVRKQVLRQLEEKAAIQTELTQNQPKAVKHTTSTAGEADIRDAFWYGTGHTDNRQESSTTMQYNADAWGKDSGKLMMEDSLYDTSTYEWGTIFERIIDEWWEKLKSDQPKMSESDQTTTERPAKPSLGETRRASALLGASKEEGKHENFITSMQKENGGHVNDTEKYILRGDIWLAPPRTQGHKYCTKCERPHYLDKKCYGTSEVHSEAPADLKAAILAAPKGRIRLLTQTKQREPGTFNGAPTFDKNTLILLSKVAGTQADEEAEVYEEDEDENNYYEDDDEVETGARVQVAKVETQARRSPVGWSRGWTPAAAEAEVDEGYETSTDESTGDSEEETTEAHEFWSLEAGTRVKVKMDSWRMSLFSEDTGTLCIKYSPHNIQDRAHYEWGEEDLDKWYVEMDTSDHEDERRVIILVNTKDIQPLGELQEEVEDPTQ